ncbi:MAG TPA: amidohydrolase family protein [Alicyclobacillus sp.]|nr:amidohydrolase family protein [Alicyclobacillus sp.]
MTFFDSHLHIIDPRFPLIENQGFVPEPFTCEDYTRRISNFHVIGGAVVSGSFQGFDQTYLVDALQKLGSTYVGVTQLPHTVSDDEIMTLNQKGVRGVRFNVRRGGSEDISKLDYLARRVHDVVGWHAEIYIDSKFLPDIAPTIRNLPAVSIDHLGLSKDGFDTLLFLVDQGVRVKATGFGRVDIDIKRAIRSIASVNPHALMFGTDLPSTRARRPFENADIDILLDALGDVKLSEMVLYRNALQWYRVEMEGISLKE